MEIGIGLRAPLSFLRRLVIATFAISALATPCRADFDAAYKAYLGGDKDALLKDLTAIASAHSKDDFEIWRTAMMASTTSVPPSIRGVAPEDTKKALQVLADGLFAAKRSDSLMKLASVLQQFGLVDDEYRVYEFAAKLDNVPAILALSGAAARRGDIATQMALDEKAATLGDIQAMYRTACAYFGNFAADGRIEKYRLPRNFFNETLGCFNVYHSRPNEALAINWYRKAAIAEFGTEAKSGILAWFYFRGIGTAEDHEKAFRFFMQQARDIDPDLGPHACFMHVGAALEEMFRLGLGTKKNENYVKYFRSHTRISCAPEYVK